MAEIMFCVNNMVKTLVGIGENAGLDYQHSLLFSQCFLKASTMGGGGAASLKMGIMWVGLTLYQTTKFLTGRKSKHLQL